MPTLADVARIAGVSKATASRALSHGGSVSPRTMARVRAVADQLGFIPNRAATALARGRSGLVNIVVPSLDNQYFTPIIAAAQDVAERHELLLSVAVQTLENSADEKSIQRLARQVDGFVLLASQSQEALLRDIARQKPVILVDRELPGLSSVLIDTEQAYARVVDELIRAGHRRIAMVGGPAGSWHNRLRVDFVAAAIGGRAEMTILGPYPPTLAGGSAAADAVIQADVDVAIPYARDVGLGLALGLRLAGVAVPGDVAVSLAPEDADLLGITRSWWVASDETALGTAAMNELLSLLRDDTGQRLAQRLPFATVHAPDGRSISVGRRHTATRVRPIRSGTGRPQG